MMKRYIPGIVGWAVTLGTVVVYDTWAIRTKRPTMSATLGHFLAHPVLGPVLAGAGGGLMYHLYVEEAMPAFLAHRADRTRLVPSGQS